MNKNLNLMSVSDIARTAGVDLSTVSNWRKRFADTFPPAIADPAGGKRARFDRTAVQEWLAANPQLGVGNPSNLRGTHALVDSLRGAMDVSAATDLIGAALVVTKALKLPADELSSLVTSESPRAILPDTVVPLVDDVQWERVPRRQLPDIFAAVNHVSDPAFEYRALLAQRSNRLGDFTEHTTPDVLTDFLLALTPESAGTCFDPTAGTGGLLLTAIDQGKARHGIGVDISRSAITVARRIAYLEDREDVEFHLANVITHDPVADLKADLVVCDPPLGMKGPEYPRVQGWPYGPPKPSSMDLGWLQICLQHLSITGTAVAVTTPGALHHTDRASVEIRSGMVRDGVIRSIVLLPGRTRANTAIPLAVWVLGPSAPEQPELLLVDASGFEHSDLHAEGPIASTVNAWMADPNFALDPSFATAVPVRALLTPDVNLLPTRYMTTWSEDRTPREWADYVTAQMTETRTALSSLAVGDVPFTVVPQESTPTMASLGDLIKGKSVRLIRRRHWQVDTDSSTGPRILNPRALRDDDIDAQRAFDEPGPWNAVVRPGDVVAMPTADTIHAQVWNEEGWVPGSYVDVLRVEDDSLDPSYLAAALMHPRNRKFIVASSVRAQVDIHALRIPLLPVAAQRRFADAHQMLADRETALKKSFTAITALRQTLSDGFASAAIDIDFPPERTAQFPGTTNQEKKDRH